MTTFRQLEALVAIVEMGSFEKAAGSINTSQSAISRLIQDLEGQMHSPLFNREGRAASLTMEGQEVLALARLILKQRDIIQERFTGITTSPRLVRLGATELVAMTWLPRFIAGIKRRHQHLRIELTVSLTPNIYSLLRDRRLDLGFVGNISHFAGMLRIPSGSAQFGWYSSPQLGLPDYISQREFEKQTILVLGPSRGTGLQINKWLLGSQIKPENTINCDSWTAMLGIAAAGLGIACLPLAMAVDAVNRGTLRRIHIDQGAPTLEYVALIRNDAQSEFYREALALAQSVCDFKSPLQPAPTSEPAQLASSTPQSC